MFIGLTLITFSLIGLFLGIRNKNRAQIRNSIIALIVIAILWIVYSIMYAMNPY